MKKIETQGKTIKDRTSSALKIKCEAGRKIALLVVVTKCYFKKIIFSHHRMFIISVA